MNNQTTEIIDSNQIKTLSEFDSIGEVFNNTDHYAVGVFAEDVLIRTRGLDGGESATFLFERANYAELLARIEDAYAGKIKELKAGEYLTVKKGKDYLVININQTFPHTSFAPIIQFRLHNNRTVVLDESESGGWDLYMSIETGRKLLEELKRIETEVVNY